MNHSVWDFLLDIGRADRPCMWDWQTLQTRTVPTWESWHAVKERMRTRIMEVLRNGNSRNATGGGTCAGRR